jgi:hypothetical protein
VSSTLEAPRSPEEEIRRRLGRDTPYWARALGVEIADDLGNRSVVKPRWAQLELDRVIVEQQNAGLPVRVIVLKSRKTGVSTWTQLKFLQRATSLDNHGCYTVAHTTKTAGELYKMAYTGYVSLPEDPDVKPPIRNRAESEELFFGQKSSVARDMGDLGRNSMMQWSTAKDADAGRGYTIRSLHGSEVAMWPDVDNLLTSLLNAIPEQDPDTMIVLESTARGHNAFKDEWDKAEGGETDFVPVFIPWWRDPVCERPFANDVERDAFVSSIGFGEWTDETRLVDQFGCTAEQLAWRRSAIRNRLRGNVQKFRQEYPASPEEAFIASGATVFAGVVIEQALDAARETPSPDVGRLEQTDSKIVKGRIGTLEVATAAEFVPVTDPTTLGLWQIHEHPTAAGDAIPLEQLDAVTRLGIESGVLEPPVHEYPGAYVLAEDPADPDEEAIESGDGGVDEAASGLVIINHRTRELVATLETFDDPDLVAQQAYLAALYYNRALIAIETTGGYGGAAARRIYHDYAYPFVYIARQVHGRKERTEERLGFKTTRETKPVLIDDFREVLRDRPELVRSLPLAKQLTWFVRLGRGRSGPQRGKRADLLMALMIAHYVANTEPVPRARGTRSSATRPRVRRSIGGYP